MEEILSNGLFNSNINSTLDINYEADVSTLEGKIKRFCSELGGDPNVINWLYKIDDYKEFVRKVKAYTADAHEDKLLTEDDEELIREQYSKEKFMDNKKILKEVFAFYDEELAGVYSGKEKKKNSDFKFPTREILNGNFPKYDKKLLTQEIKVSLRVHDLSEEEYDIFVNPDTGILIPVYYNIATANDKWFAFCIYLKKLYSALNIDANYFLPLITFDRDLLGIDCTNEHHTNYINGKIAMECERNIIFAVRECARFVSAEGTKERTEISLGDWTWLWLYAQCFNTYREAPRQTGKTFLMTMVFGIEFAVSYKDLMAIVVHFKSSEAIKNRNKMLDSANALPTYLKYHNIKYKTLKGKEKIEMSATDMIGGGSPKSENLFKKNVLKTVAVGKTESTAEQAGRGDTTQLISADEINFISQVGVLLTALTFAHSTARTLAKKAGKRYGMHFTSTAGKLNTKHGKEMYDLIYNKMCAFQLELFAYNLSDLETYLKANSTVNFFVIKYGYDELGYTEEWLDDRIMQSKSTQDILVEIFQRWLSVDASSLFKLDLVKRLEALTRKCIERNFMYKKNNLIKYFPLDPSLSFEDTIRGIQSMGFGIDVSAGGGDYSVIYAYDMRTLRPAFLYKVNNLVVTDFAIVSIDIMRYVKHINPGMTLCVNPEQNGPGLSYIPILTKERDIEPHIFRHLRNYDSRVSDETMKPWHRRFSKDSYIEYGSNMKKNMDNGRSLRNVMFEDMLFEIMDKYPYILGIPDLASEIFTLHRKSGKIDGKIEAKSGFHDDITCACLHGVSMILIEEHRRMLSRFFNYTVDLSFIDNMAISSHIDNFESLDMYHNLDNKIDIEVRDMYGVGGIHYQVLKLFKYVNNIRTEIKDQDEKNKLYRENEEVKEALANTKKLTLNEFKTIENHNMKEALNSVRSNPYIGRQGADNGANVNRNVNLDNRTSSYQYKANNRYNTKAKMF